MKRVLAPAGASEQQRAQWLAARSARRMAAKGHRRMVVRAIRELVLMPGLTDDEIERMCDWLRRNKNK